MTGNEEKPPKVIVQSLPNGRVLVRLPEEYRGEVVLHCTGGIVGKYHSTDYGRPLGHEVELTETTGEKEKG